LERASDSKAVRFVLGDDPVPAEAVGCHVIRLRFRGVFQPTAFASCERANDVRWSAR
jgi:hypothetical protein